jgi:hypothetical protein
MKFPKRQQDIGRALVKKMRPIESTHERKDTGDGIGEMEGKTWNRGMM